MQPCDSDSDSYCSEDSADEYCEVEVDEDGEREMILIPSQEEVSFS